MNLFSLRIYLIFSKIKMKKVKPKKDGNFNIDLDDEIISGAIFTHDGTIIHQPTLQAIEKS